MGLYDEVEVNGRCGQIKTWGCDLRRYQQGDEVPSLHGVDSYDIAMRDGGYVHIHSLHITGWTDEPEHEVIVDKWGDLFSNKSRGLLNEGYLHRSSALTRTTLSFTVLSREPIPAGLSLEQIIDECEDGTYIWEANLDRKAEGLTPTQMAQALIAAGSDPEFFDLGELLPPAAADDA